MAGEDYNSEPVLYCPHCLSLRIVSIDDTDELLYCDECGNTDIKQTNIEEWERLYQAKYGKTFLKKK